MYEDCYLCECNIEYAEKVKKKLWDSFLNTNSRYEEFSLGFRLSHYNDVILYNSVMMSTHGDFNYGE